MTANPRYVVTDYWSGDCCSYPGVLHSPGSDAPKDAVEVLRKALAQAGVHNGDEIEVTVTKTGRRPFGDRKMRLIAPHQYEREK